MANPWKMEIVPRALFSRKNTLNYLFLFQWEWRGCKQDLRQGVANATFGKVRSECMSFPLTAELIIAMSPCLLAGIRIEKTSAGFSCPRDRVTLKEAQSCPTATQKQCRQVVRCPASSLAQGEIDRRIKDGSVTGMRTVVHGPERPEGVVVREIRACLQSLSCRRARSIGKSTRFDGLQLFVGSSQRRSRAGQS
jgi:hypothetical protein